MKKLFCLLAVVGVMFTACDPDTPEIIDDAYISLNKEIVNFSPDGESVDIKVYSNYDWTLSTTCDWVTISATSGEASEDGATITLTADLTYDDREGSITFSCGNAKKVLAVSQDLKESIIADENNTFNVPAKGGTVELAYQTSVECEVIIPEEAQSWISLASDATKGLVSEVATLNVAKSNTGVQRSAVVKVVKKDDSSLCVEYTITQERNMDYVILYTTTDGNTITPNSFSYISNTYEDGVGMLVFDGSKVTSIGDSAFYGCSSLTSITIPDSVTSIGDWAFADCSSLTSITIPDSVTSIGSLAFYECTSLARVDISDLSAWCKIRFSNYSANPHVHGAKLYLNGSELTDITIPSDIAEIKDFTFYNCTSLTSVTIGNSVTSIGGYAFSSCSSLTSVTIGDSVTSIGDWAFEVCTSLTSVTIPDSVTSIGRSAFACCSSLTSVTIPDSVTSIGDYAFASCSSLTSITIPDSVTSIGNWVFAECTSLTSVTIGDSVTSIGDYAFYGCTSLKSVYCKPTTPPEGYTRMFYNNASGRKIYVPTASVSAYKSAPGWNNYASSIIGYDF